MYHNKILSLAITTTICMGSQSTLSFENARDGMVPAVLDTAYTPRRPVAAFDFDSETVIKIPDQVNGVMYATELFGESRTLPSGDNPSAGTFAATIYTIDGQIDRDFEITFTLSNGALFDGEPWLGIDDSTVKSLADANIISSLAAGECQVILENKVPFSIGDIFQLNTHSTLYEIVENKPTMEGKMQIRFRQLGTGENVLSEIANKGLEVPVDGTAIPVKVYKYKPEAFETTDNGALVVDASDWQRGISARLANIGYPTNVGTNSIANVHTGIDKLIIGAYYQIGTKTAENIYQVTGKTLDGNIVITPSLHNHFGSDTSKAAITRYHHVGDTAIHVGNVAAFQVGNLYQFHNHPSVYTVTKRDQTNGNNVITIQNTIGYGGLTHNVSSQTQAYRLSGFIPTQNENWTNSGSYTSLITKATGRQPALPLKPKSGSGSGQQNVTFFVPAGEDTALKLTTGDRLMLLYKLRNTQVLANLDEKIEMTVGLITPLTQIKLNPRRKITIARSKPGLVTPEMRVLETGEVKISVFADSKEFVSGPFLRPDYAFLATDQVQIGYLNLDNDTSGAYLAKTADGETPFQIGKLGAEADKSTLMIEKGQFAGSLFSPGKVFLNIKGQQALIADEVTETTATWQLNNADLQKIAAAETDQITFRIKVNGQAAINVPNQPPKATLTLDFDDPKTTDITASSVLRWIKKNGTTCHVFNVPNTKATESISIRITNDSNEAGQLTGTLYDMDGQELIEAGTPLFDGEAIKPNETKRLMAKELEELAGTSWTGRARLVISSSLPKMEVMSLLREKRLGAPLTNLSLGARGNSCEN